MSIPPPKFDVPSEMVNPLISASLSMRKSPTEFCPLIVKTALPGPSMVTSEPGASIVRGDPVRSIVCGLPGGNRLGSKLMIPPPFAFASAIADRSVREAPVPLPSVKL